MKSKQQSRYLQKTLSKLARDDPKTQQVVLNGFTIQDDKMARLAMSLVGNTHIKILSLNNCGITSQGAHLLAYALSHNRSLSHVWLNQNKIGSSGAEAIASALSKCPSLLTLGLANNSIGNRGGRALADALAQNRTITDVFVQDNRMSGRVEDQIIRIVYYEDESDCDDDINEETYPSCHDGIPHSVDVYDDNTTICESVCMSVSSSYLRNTLNSIKEVDYESDSVGSDDHNDSHSTASSTADDDEPIDLDFTCFYQKKKKESKIYTKLVAIKGMLRRKKVGPGQ